MALHLPREDALSVLDGIGHRDMGKWTDEKIVSELGRIPESIEDDFELEGDDDLTLRDILAEIEGGSPCIIVGSSDDVDDGPEEDATETEAVDTKDDAAEAETEDDEVAEDDGDDSSEDETKATKAAERAAKKEAKAKAKEDAKAAKEAVRALKKGDKAKAAADRKANKKMSLIDAAAKVLADEGHPMKCAEIVDLAIERKYWAPGKGKNPAHSLDSSFWVSIKNEKGRFKKTDKAMYDLA